MSEFPELQQALVDAARRGGRRPRARAWPPGRAALALAACVAGLGVAAVLLARAPDEERPAPPATAPAHPLAEHYAVFRRPVTAGDTLPDVPRIREGLGGADGAAFDPSTARLLLADGGLRIFAAEAPMNGTSSICVFLVEDGGTDRYGCELAGAPTDDWQVAGGAWAARDGGDVFAAVVTDRIGEVELVFPDGSSELVAVSGNVAFAELTRSPAEIAWRDAAGRRQTETLPDRTPPGGPEGG